MTTPMSAFIKIACDYGNVDSQDIEGVIAFFESDFKEIKQDDAQLMLDELIGNLSGEQSERAVDSYSDSGALPTLEESPVVVFSDDLTKDAWTLPASSVENVYALSDIFESAWAVSRVLIEGNAAAMSHIFTTRSATSDAITPSFEKLQSVLMAQWQIGLTANMEMQKIFLSQIQDAYRSQYKALESTLSRTAKSTSAAGSSNTDRAVMAVKSAFAAANAAFENLNKAAREVAELAEANVAAAEHTTKMLKVSHRVRTYKKRA